MSTALRSLRNQIPSPSHAQPVVGILEQFGVMNFVARALRSLTDLVQISNSAVEATRTYCIPEFKCHGQVLMEALAMLEPIFSLRFDFLPGLG